MHLLSNVVSASTPVLLWLNPRSSSQSGVVFVGSIAQLVEKPRRGLHELYVTVLNGVNVNHGHCVNPNSRNLGNVLMCFIVSEEC